MLLNSGKLDKFFSTPGKKFFAAAITTALAATAASHTSAAVLGPATGYNIFTTGDLNMNGTDVTGSVAVGGNANFNNYTVDQNLVVNGNLTNTFATLGGNGIINGTVNWNTPSINGSFASNNNVTFTGGGSTASPTQHLGTFTAPSYFAHTQITSPVSLPVDFSTAAATLTNISNAAASLPANGTTTNAFNTITFSGSDPSLNIFNLSLSDLQSSVGFHFSVPTGSTTLINVLGSGSASLPNTGFQGDTDDLLLWNFANYTSLTVGSFDGSVLAPNANVTAHSGGFNGQIIASSVSAGGAFNTDEFHNVLFDGNLGQGSSRVPEPASLGLLILGSLILTRRRRAH